MRFTFTLLSCSLPLALCALALGQDDGPVAAAEFSHTAIHVRDVKSSAAFYETVLGLKRMPDPFKDELHVWFRIGARGQLHVIGGSTRAVEHDVTSHMAFSVASVEEFASRLDRSQIRYVSSKREERKVTLRPDGIRQIYFQDPDGYWIEVNDDRS